MLDSLKIGLEYLKISHNIVCLVGMGGRTKSRPNEHNLLKLFSRLSMRIAVLR